MGHIPLSLVTINQHTSLNPYANVLLAMQKASGLIFGISYDMDQQAEMLKRLEAAALSPSRLHWARWRKLDRVAIFYQLAEICLCAAPQLSYLFQPGCIFTTNKESTRKRCIWCGDVLKLEGNSYFASLPLNIKACWYKVEDLKTNVNTVNNFRGFRYA